MTYYSSTTTEPANSRVDDIRLESNATHHIMIVPWEHSYENSVDVKVTNSPFKIEANSFDGLNYHSLALTLSLNYEITFLKDSFFDLYEKGFRIHIPKENMKRRKVETVSLARK